MISLVCWAGQNKIRVFSILMKTNTICENRPIGLVYGTESVRIGPNDLIPTIDTR